MTTDEELPSDDGEENNVGWLETQGNAAKQLREKSSP